MTDVSDSMASARPASISEGRRGVSRGLGYGACAVAGIFWSTGFFLGKIAFQRLSVDHFVLYRFLFACAGLLFVVERPRFSGSQWRLLLIASFLGIPVQFLVQFYGLHLTTVSHAALMVGTMPVILAVGATMFSGEHLDRKGWLALAGSTLGIVLIISSTSRHVTGGGNLLGDLLVIAAMFFSLAWILLNQRLMREGHSPMAVTVWGILTGTVMLAIWVLARSGLPPVHGIGGKIWLAVAASGLLCTAAATLLWNWGIHHVPASRAGVFLNIEPALGAVLGVELLGDRLGLGTWIGGALIIAAAVVLTTTEKQEPEVLVG
ncbi:MAG TPA: EamA family transporter [Acidobacteriaceae bacterium]|nr:EamA family transporter [Acidobacteriaceae bacterium]